MPSAAEELIWGNPDPGDLRLLLPLAFPELLGWMGGLAGLATLLSESDQDALEEAASWGYGEEGFFYPFLAKGSSIRNKLELSNSPFFLPRSNEIEFYREDARGCLLAPVRVQEKLFGFFLLELGSVPDERQILLLGLFCQKISGLLIPSFTSKESRSKSGKGEDSLGALLFQLSRGENSQLEKFQKTGTIFIQGPPASGKKTLAKWIHRKYFSDRSALSVSVLPEQILKLEKSLAEWEKMAQFGSIIFENLEEYSLNQQRILYEYSQRKTAKCRLIFLEKQGSQPREEFIYFRSLLRENRLELPAWKEWGRAEKRSAILPIFQEVCEMHGRPDLNLSQGALDSLVDGSSCQNLEDLRNAIEEAVLNSGSGEIRNSELNQEKAKGVSLPDPEDLDLRKAVEAVERQKILLADKLFGGNQIRMAKALGISRGSLQYKLRNLGLG
ncbi:transcriptional regulator [Leptospira langatensis]|uniref:Transcriptional regulator n=2 Tax=Leptospira langatensis TaxID=2484983 RepID=A0A5F1ZQD5_9LEPT|nr:transcriptional regulator [Leptospira langatensis]TGL39530.1 transcriptional regulator [Leptospira langatensis]